MDNYYQKLREYWKVCYEKDNFIADWMYYVLGITGFALGIYNKWGFILILVATYKLALREGKRDGFIDGFDERGSLEESRDENSTSLEAEMDETINHFRKAKKQK